MHLTAHSTTPLQSSTHTHTHTYQVGTILHFTWEKDEEPLTYDKRISLSNGNNSSNITFSTVTEEDSGFYICKVVTRYNGVQGPLVTSISINVTAAPGEFCNDIHSSLI